MTRKAMFVGLTGKQVAQRPDELARYKKKREDMLKELAEIKERRDPNEVMRANDLQNALPHIRPPDVVYRVAAVGDDFVELRVQWARENRDKYRKEGHEVKYIELRGLGHTWGTKAEINETICKSFADHPREQGQHDPCESFTRGAACPLDQRPRMSQNGVV